MAKKDGKVILAKLKEDRDKAMRDVQAIQQNLIMVQGVIAYLNTEIQKLEQGGE